MDSLIFELQIVFYFQLFLSANVRYIQVAGYSVVFINTRANLQLFVRKKFAA